MWLYCTLFLCAFLALFFFANDIACCLYSFQTIEMMLDKKQIWVIFKFELKMGYKAAETTCNINKAFGPGTANEYTMQWWFKKFCKGGQSLEDEEHSGWSLKVDSDQLRGS